MCFHPNPNPPSKSRPVRKKKWGGKTKVPDEFSGGDCFEAAGGHLLEREFLSPKDPSKGDLRLVHAEIEGNAFSGPLFGLRFAHAFILDKKTDTVIDLSNNRDLRMAAPLYFMLHGITDNYHEYTFPELKRYASKYKHWGPWHLETEHEGPPGTGLSSEPTADVKREARKRLKDFMEKGQSKIPYPLQENPSQEEIKIMTKTGGGAFGGRMAVVPRALLEMAEGNQYPFPSPTSSILDFGAGHGKHTDQLRSSGFENVTAYDFPDSKYFRDGFHDPNALDHEYEWIMASNVLNVQPSLVALRETLDQLSSALGNQEGAIIANFPASPRKMEDLGIVGKGKMKPIVEKEIKKRFSTFFRYPHLGSPSTPVWILGNF